jgi:hypothetical protein
MPIATSTNEGAFFASQNVQGKFQAGTLATSLSAWLNGIAAAMNTPVGAGDVDSIAQRTVYNLIPIGRDLLNSVTNSTLDQFAANEVSIYLNRCCRAIQFAQANGRITATQAAALVSAAGSQYNVIWS